MMAGIKEAEKSKTKMGEDHYACRYIWYDDNREKSAWRRTGIAFARTFLAFILSVEQVLQVACYSEYGEIIDQCH